MKKTLGFLFVWWGTAFVIQAQDVNSLGTYALSSEVIEAGELVDLSTVEWRFQEGDDAAWAALDWDDSAWGLMDTDFQPDTLHEVWQGIGWFRLRLRVDSSLQQTTLGLQTYHLGASEIYLNGERVGAFGRVGANAEQDQAFIPKGLPLSLHLDNRSEHVLAVRYSNRMLASRTILQFRERQFLTPGFALVVGPNRSMIQGYVFEGMKLYIDALIMGVLLLILCLHLLLYGFDRRERANLFYALAVTCLCIAHFAGHAVGYRVMVVDGQINLPWLDSLGGHGFFWFALFLLATLYQLYASHLLPYLRWGVVTWVVLTMGLLLMPISVTGDPFAFVVFLGYPVMLESVRVASLAVYRRQEGARLLGGALVVTLAVMLYALAQPTPFEGPRTPRTFIQEDSHLLTSVGMWLMLFYFPLPLGMSALLARRFVQRSRRLENELERVAELSQQMLEQEREKQELIARQNERLEAEVEVRTAELQQSQQQLIHAEKMASLGLLTAGIAHEIKNPLNFINNFAEVNEELAQELREALADGDDPEEIIADLEQNATVIAQHGRRADSIVKSMMAHARSGNGERIPTDLNALVNEHIDLAYHGKRATTPGFTVSLERDLDEAVGEVYIVPQDIGRVVLNLLSNAFDVLDEVPDPQVRVATRRSDNHIEIRVADNGPGMPDEIKAKVFEPFFTTKPTGQGTGLGLSLSYDIITQGHGGTMNVESAAGKGASFIALIP